MEMIIGEKKYVGTMTYVRRDFEEVLDAVASGKSPIFRLVLRFKVLVFLSVNLPDQDAANTRPIQFRAVAAGQNDHGPDRS
jgi:hypothetical protein